jgi:hypothetical protein
MKLIFALTLVGGIIINGAFKECGNLKRLECRNEKEKATTRQQA